jgi:hypothetical protein
MAYRIASPPEPAAGEAAELIDEIRAWIGPDESREGGIGLGPRLLRRALPYVEATARKEKP